jgi:hypothetical protein
MHDGFLRCAKTWICENDGFGVERYIASDPGLLFVSKRHID